LPCPGCGGGGIAPDNGETKLGELAGRQPLGDRADAVLVQGDLGVEVADPASQHIEGQRGQLLLDPAPRA
jgi:hypothetical protein